MNTIMAIDLGKFKSVACIFDVNTKEETYITIKTTPEELHDLVVAHKVDLIVFEACGIIGWICDVLDQLELNYLVSKTNIPEWRYRVVKKKTDRADALWLAKHAAIGNLVGVYVPLKLVREKRHLINFRKSVVEELTRIKNQIRALLDSHAIHTPGGRGDDEKEIM